MRVTFEFTIDYRGEWYNAYTYVKITRDDTGAMVGEGETRSTNGIDISADPSNLDKGAMFLSTGLYTSGGTDAFDLTYYPQARITEAKLYSE